MAQGDAFDRYSSLPRDWFRRCGRSGLLLPAISFGMWHNFGGADDADNARQMCQTAFDLGITHFDLANMYGPPPGHAEALVGRILQEMPRHELVISTKAGYRMWPGPYGEWGSRKYLLSSLDESLRRMKLEYVDIFYSHRPDPAVGATPLEETLGALDQAVRSGKAIYAGISSYNSARTAEAVGICQRDRLAPITIHQPDYSMFSRWIEKDLLAVVERAGIGVIAFCPLAQGLLTTKYLKGIPADSRAASATGYLRPQHVTADRVAKAQRLNDFARQRGQSLPQLALAWVLRDARVTSALIGASRPDQIQENVKAVHAPAFAADELQTIDEILNG
jgi:L-glyceraldehyde 3-phosphate reductase